MKTYRNLQEITGHESGAVFFEESGEILICNWVGVQGIPRLDPFGYHVLGLGETLYAKRVAVPKKIIQAMQEHEREQGTPISRTGFKAWEVAKGVVVAVQSDWH